MGPRVMKMVLCRPYVSAWPNPVVRDLRGEKPSCVRLHGARLWRSFGVKPLAWAPPLCRSNLTPFGFTTKGTLQGEARSGYTDYLASEPVLRREFRRTVRRLKASNPPGTKLLEVGFRLWLFLG